MGEMTREAAMALAARFNAAGMGPLNADDILRAPDYFTEEWATRREEAYARERACDAALERMYSRLACALNTTFPRRSHI